MILGESKIIEYVESGKIVVKPFNPKNVQPSSLDLTLGKEFMRPKDDGVIDVKEGVEYQKFEADEIVIGPGEFILATTEEWVEIPKGITAFLEGRSSIGRLGLFIHNAGWIDTGFKGKITLELYNANKVPIKIYAGMRICQIIFSRIDGQTDGYRGKYLGQSGVEGSKIQLDWGEKRG